MRLLRKPDDAHVQAVMHDVAACFVRVCGGKGRLKFYRTISEVKTNELVTYDLFKTCDECFSGFKRERLRNNAKTCRGHVSHAVTQGITH